MGSNTPIGCAIKIQYYTKCIESIAEWLIKQDGNQKRGHVFSAIPLVLKEVVTKDITRASTLIARDGIDVYLDNVQGGRAYLQWERTALMGYTDLYDRAISLAREALSASLPAARYLQITAEINTMAAQITDTYTNAIHPQTGNTHGLSMVIHAMHGSVTTDAVDLGVTGAAEITTADLEAISAIITTFAGEKTTANSDLINDKIAEIIDEKTVIVALVTLCTKFIQKCDNITENETNVQNGLDAHFDTLVASIRQDATNCLNSFQNKIIIQSAMTNTLCPIYNRHV